MSCSRTQHNDAGEAQARRPSASSQALYYWATALPSKGISGICISIPLDLTILNKHLKMTRYDKIYTQKFMTHASCYMIYVLTLCLIYWEILQVFLSSDLFNFFEKFFRNTIRVCVKQFGSRSSPTFCQAGPGSKLFAKMISRWH